jgi:hypothetical protein
LPPMFCVRPPLACRLEAFLMLWQFESNVGKRQATCRSTSESRGNGNQMHLKAGNARALVILLALTCGSGGALADGDVLDAVAALNSALKPLGTRTALGNWDGGNGCAMTGMAFPEDITVVNARGTAPRGFVMGQEEVTLSALHPEVLSRRTFRNCTSQTDTSTRQISQGYTQSVTITMAQTTSTSITATLSGTGSMGVWSATTTVSGTRSWSATTTDAQTETKSFTISDSITAPLPSMKEFDIIVSVIRGESQVPVYVDAVLDGDTQPCLIMAEKTASQLLPEPQRTFRLSGRLTFSHADNGQIIVSTERPAQCTN